MAGKAFFRTRCGGLVHGLLFASHGTLPARPHLCLQPSELVLVHAGTLHAGLRWLCSIVPGGGVRWLA
jgi:hypothetical protein